MSVGLFFIITLDLERTRTANVPNQYLILTQNIMGAMRIMAAISGLDPLQRAGCLLERQKHSKSLHKGVRL